MQWQEEEEGEEWITERRSFSAKALSGLSFLVGESEEHQKDVWTLSAQPKSGRKESHKRVISAQLESMQDLPR